VNAPPDTDVLEALEVGDLRPLGRIVGSSNSAVLVEVTHEGSARLAIHKPIAFEAPLWDYPDGHLAYRERAAYLISAVADFAVVPATILRDGPWGPGSLQEWVGGPDDVPELVVTVTDPDDVPDGWLVVLDGEDRDGQPVRLSHADDPALRSTAVLDAVLNNSDRKGGHLVRVGGVVRGFDHGVSLGVEPKLRTVLWGWAGQPIPDADLTRLHTLAAALNEPAGPLTEVDRLLTAAEVDALTQRVAHLIRTGAHPHPTPNWPAIPWPPM